MKVIALNGSARAKGNTYEALTIVAAALEKTGVETKIIPVGNTAIAGCKACGSCRSLGKCVLDDAVNPVAAEIAAADGLLLGAPVHYASIAGTTKNFFDRLFFSADKKIFRYKPAAAVVSVRRSGGVSAFQALTNYFTISEMFVVSSNYWNVIHGNAEGEALADSEGVQIMRVLGHNMAWLLNAIALAKASTPPPDAEPKTVMSFIR